MHNLKLHELFTKNTIFASVIQNARTTGFRDISLSHSDSRKKEIRASASALWFYYFCFVFMWYVFYLHWKFIIWLTLDTSKIFDNKEVHLLPLCTFWAKIFICLCCLNVVFFNKKEKEHGIFYIYSNIYFAEIHSRIWCTFEFVYVQRGSKEGFR